MQKLLARSAIFLLTVTSALGLHVTPASAGADVDNDDVCDKAAPEDGYPESERANRTCKEQLKSCEIRDVPECIIVLPPSP